MRIVRLFGVVLTILTAGLLLAPSAGAQPPSKLLDHITDDSAVLTPADRTAVGAAIDRLYQDRHIQLWVVYVDNFNRFKPDNWADKTRTESAMGDHDVLLAVATNTKLYTFSVPPQVQGITAAELNTLQSNKIQPAVGAKNWSGAAVAAADGLDKPGALDKSATSSTRIWVLIGIGALVLVVVIVVVLLLLRARRRRRAARQGFQISDYVSRHHDSIGTQAQTRFEETKRYLAAAHGRAATNDREAIAYAKRASTLAAQAQTLANADVLAAHHTPRRRGAAGS
jgi:uncharacterized membrane protein YgcG